MFYSQFILAKKGPLGTIWIAAHLERKLRKNQVADTDIGVSVDSILFPEVPIALRLSSHLLLGVVRIYSRKVNYLFHDCSEALLKIKQAFRSTAVDLPPEESTAPYHSITLPETFDLDDFELPDNAFIHGNFVDRHVCAREQITLQDTMDDVVYSTSQFGLDERFGDGDASQIGLDFDEDLFADKTRSPGHHNSALLSSDADVDLQASGQPSACISNMDIDEHQNKSGEDRSSEHMLELNAGGWSNQIQSNTQDLECALDFPVLHGDDVQTPDLNDEAFPFSPYQGPTADMDKMDIAPSVQGPFLDLNEESSPYAAAQAPSTPGLMEEAIPASVQGLPPSGHLKRTPVSSPVEGSVLDVTCNSHLEPKIQGLTSSLFSDSLGNRLNEPDLGIVDTSQVVNSSLNEKASDILTNLQPIAERNLEIERVLPENNFEAQALDILDPEEPVVLPAKDSGIPGLGNVVPEEPVALPAMDSGIPELGNVAPEEPVVLHFETLNPVRPDENLFVSNCVIQPRGTAFMQSTLSTPQVELAERNVSSLLFREMGCGTLDGPQQSEIPNPSGHDEHSCARCHVLQPCGTTPKQLALSTAEGELAEANFMDLSSRELELCTSEAPGTEEPMDGGAQPMLAKVQGHECRTTEVIDSTLAVQQKLQAMPCDIVAVHNKSDECLDAVLSSSTQTGVLPPPEKLLLVPTFGLDLLDDLVMKQPIAEKEALVECENSVDVGKNICGKKRRLMESTPLLQNGNPSKFSGAPRSERMMDFIPDDDDILASILVGRKTPVLKMRPTPPPTEVASFKRPRPMPRASVLKRKVALDETMVLHGDAIRAQLTNTEDIRRVRRKAPCTPPEIWAIQKHLLEDQIFNEPLLTGMSVELTGLYDRDNFTRIGVPNIGDKNSHSKLSKELELSKEVELTKECRIEGGDELPGNFPEMNNDQVQEYTEASIGNHTFENPVDSHAGDAQVPVETPTDIALLDLSKMGQSVEIASMEMHVHDNADANIECHAAFNEAEDRNLACHSGNACNGLTDFRIESPPTTNGKEGMPEKNDKSFSSPDQKSGIQPLDVLAEVNGETLLLTKSTRVDASSDKVDVNDETSVLSDSALKFPVECRLDEQKTVNDERLVAISGDVSRETGGDVIVDSSSVLVTVNPSNLNVTMESSLQTDLAISADGKAIRETESKTRAVVENEVLSGNMRVNPHIVDPEGNLVTERICTDGPVTASSCPKQPIVDPEIVPTDDFGQNLSRQEINQEGAEDVDHIAMDIAAVNDSGLDPLKVAEDVDHSAMEIAAVNDSGVDPLKVAEDVVHTAMDNAAVNDSGVDPLKVAEDVDHTAMDNAAVNDSGVDPLKVAEDVDHTAMDNAAVNDSGVDPLKVAEDVDHSAKEIAAVNDSGVDPLKVAEDVDHTAMDIAAVNDSGVDPLKESDHIIDGNNTEFLNVDDEVVHEEAGDNNTSSEEAQLLENSGWSSRTRAVARYLQSMFDNKHGLKTQKILPMDRLLVGKTRKEASRMFFEALVLKTRDYIHVEQEAPFANIDIQPTPKLTKSEF